MTGYLEIRKDFTFEAGHYFEHMPQDHGYRRFHGHSFHVEVTLRGTPAQDSGWIADFADVDASLQDVKAQLDHQLLNDVPGLERPSLENIAIWIATALSPRFPSLSSVRVARPTCHESATYRLA